MSVADVLHHLVDNSAAFVGDAAVQAHKDISEAYKEDERHYTVPDPETEEAAQADADANASPEDQAAEIARLREELAAKG
jgi:hypothetical protein